MKNNTNRLYELDGLRGLAALVVVIFHFIYRYDSSFGHDFFVPEWLSYGKLGVHLFFMISGFVIFWTLTRSKSAIDFIWSRFSRLYPVYWVAVTITFVIVYFYGLEGRERSFDDYLINLSMLQTFFWVPHIDGVYWTLSLELSFYFWMLILFIFKKLEDIEIILIIWLLFEIFNKHYLNLDIPHNSKLKIIFLMGYISLFAAGICYYKIWNGSDRKLTWLLLFVSLITLYIQYPIDKFMILLMYYILFMLVINQQMKILASKPLVFLGVISYPLYLTHQNIGYIIINASYLIGAHPIVGLSAAFSVSIVLAVALTKYIEKPSLIFLKRIYIYINSNLKTLFR